MEKSFRAQRNNVEIHEFFIRRDCSVFLLCVIEVKAAVKMCINRSLMCDCCLLSIASEMEMNF